MGGTTLHAGIVSGVTESLFFLGGGADLHLGWGGPRGHRNEGCTSQMGGGHKV